MAYPIEPTPTLYGEDAQRLLDDIANLKYSAKKEEQIKRALATYDYHSKRMERETKRFLALQKKQREAQTASTQT